MSDGSGGPPVLWLSTNAVLLTTPTGDDGQLMSGGSGGPPVLWLSTQIHYKRCAIFSSPAARSFPFFFCIPLCRSSGFSVPTSFLFIALQSFPFLCGSFLSLFRLSRSYVIPRYRSSFRSSFFRRWGFPKHRWLFCLCFILLFQCLFPLVFLFIPHPSGWGC